MPVKIWWIWMSVSAFLIILEMLTPGFFLFWFGVGALAAGIFALMGFNTVWQWGSFVIVSGVLFAFSRKFVNKISKSQPQGIGANRLIGKKGIVLEGINNADNMGRVRIDKEEWRADSDTGEVIPAGNIVEVIRIEGTHLIVKVIKKEA